MTCDVLVVGGGLGGCAAALSASSLGLRVVMTEEWPEIGGQLVTQAVPPDEHPWIESFGCTSRYRALRHGVRDLFRADPTVREDLRLDPMVNPGGGWVSRLCAEPRLWLRALSGMLEEPIARRLVEVRRQCRPIAVDLSGERVRAVEFQNLESGETWTCEAAFVLDATEIGDLWPLVGAGFDLGSDAQRETGEPHAPSEADPEDVQAITWCMALAWEPQMPHTVGRPETYESWRALRPVGWPGPLLDLTFPDPRDGSPRRLDILGEDGLFAYRRVIDESAYQAAGSRPSVTIVNWPQNDYYTRPTLNVDGLDPLALWEARELTLSLVHWLQTECGLEGLRPRPDVSLAPEGLAIAPYIREGRRPRTLTRLSEHQVGAEANPGRSKAVERGDSVGVGAYRIDLHPSRKRSFVDIPALPYQIPMGSLVPVLHSNLIAAGKSFGVTHIANGCTRLHPVEWNVGEAAGLLAAFSLVRGVLPREVSNDPGMIAEFQSLLVSQGIELGWPEDVHPL